MFTGLGGFGVFIHTLERPNERKVRHLLLALATLGLTAASYPLVERVSREIYATAATARLQPLADALAKDAPASARSASRTTAWCSTTTTGLEDHSSPTSGGHGVQVLADALVRDGISRRGVPGVPAAPERRGRGPGGAHRIHRRLLPRWP